MPPDRRLRGPGRRRRRCGENAHKDAAPLLPQVAAQTGLAAGVVTRDLGPIAPGPAVHAEQAYIPAFFGHWLRGQGGQLLDGPSPRYPQIQFVR